MKFKRSFLLPLFMLSGQAVFCTGDDYKHKYEMPEHGSIVLTVPQKWTDKVQQPPGVLPPTIVFSPDKDPQFKVMITPMWQASPDKPLPEGKAIRDLLQQNVDHFQPEAANTILIEEMKSATGPGYYFLAIDRAPKAGEFKYMTQGSARVNDLLFTFTILTNDGQESVIKRALAMISAAERPTREPVTLVNRKDGYSITLPEGWRLKDENKGFFAEHPDGSTLAGMRAEFIMENRSFEAANKLLKYTLNAAGFCDKPPITQFEVSGSTWLGAGFHCNNLPTESTPSSQVISLTFMHGGDYFQLVLITSVRLKVE